LTVVDEQRGWLQITAPMKGWVYRDLTFTSCGNFAVVAEASQAEVNPSGATPSNPFPAPPQSGAGDRLAQAQQQFHAGNLKAALDSLKAISSSDVAYPAAQRAMQKMATQWRTAETTYQQAQQALNQQRPQQVLALVQAMPDVRYWRERMAPLVKQAIAQQAQVTALDK
jgi:hypothetical protein